MAKLTLTIEGSAVGTLSYAREYTEAASDKMMWWLMTTYGVDEDGNPRSPQEAFNAFAATLYQGCESNVKRAVVDKAAEDARAAADAAVDVSGTAL